MIIKTNPGTYIASSPGLLVQLKMSDQRLNNKTNNASKHMQRERAYVHGDWRLGYNLILYSYVKVKKISYSIIIPLPCMQVSYASMQAL